MLGRTREKAAGLGEFNTAGFMEYSGGSDGGMIGEMKTREAKEAGSTKANADMGQAAASPADAAAGPAADQAAGAEAGPAASQASPVGAAANAANTAGSTYRDHVLACDLPENAFVIESLSDYLSMMDILVKAIAHALSSSCSITCLQYRILVRLYSGQTLPAKQLASDLGIKTSTISMAVSKLAQKRLITRRDCATDMREVELSISAKGEKTTQTADAAIKAIMQSYWGSLTKKQLDAAMQSSLSAVKMHSMLRVENGKARMDTALVETVMISRMLTARALDQEGLSINGYRVMLALRVLGMRSSGAEIARFLFLNPSDITACLKNLEARKFITRRRSEENRHIRVVELTPLGNAEVICLTPVVYDALLDTCRSSEELVVSHISAARDLVVRKRQHSEFA